MGPLSVLAASEGPGWWYETWGLGDWLGTLFNQPLEVHAFLLGAFVGAILAFISARGHPRTVLTSTLAVLLFTFGTFETVLCAETFTACQHLRLKPWYFIGGFLVAHVCTVTAVHRAMDDQGNRDTEAAASHLAALITLILLGAAGYSLLLPAPVHPITGLATIGGFLGSVFGIAAYEWGLLDQGDGPRYNTTLRRLLTEDRDKSVFVVSYGTTLGFGYPRLMWELGAALGHDSFLLGPITWARYGLPSITIYVSVVFLAALVFFRSYTSRSNGRLYGAQFAALVLGFVTYAYFLLVTTGFAEILWFRLLSVP